MDANFWHQKWEANEIGFHNNETNPLLVKYFDRLALTKGSRVFLPLCGKTLDIHWLLANGYRVVGAELSKIAIEQLFAALNVKPEIVPLGSMAHYRAHHIDIFVGDIFDLTSQTLGAVNAVYDRAALIALPAQTRQRYSAHLMQITATAPQLLICLDYDQRLLEGPPFSVSGAEVQQHYRDSYAVTLLESEDVAGGLKGKCAANQEVWLLQRA